MTYYRSIVALMAVLLLGVSCSHKEETPPTPAEVVYARRASPYHIVKRGDTVDSIAKAYGMKDSELIHLNRLRTAAENIQGASHAINYEWPVKGDVIQNFGQKLPDGSISEGINIKVPANIPVKATAQGTVKVVKAAGAHPTAYGNMVVLKHPDGKMSIYAHLSEASVKTGETVQKAGILGRTGKTGAVKETQLYFQIRDQNLKPLDPITVLP
jgi:murein DD-endopeptidase MepM/ murein hydrolase activator NlpD